MAMSPLEFFKDLFWNLTFVCHSGTTILNGLPNCQGEPRADALHLSGWSGVQPQAKEHSMISCVCVCK